MSLPTRDTHNPVTGPKQGSPAPHRGPRNLLFGYAVIALAMTQVPPLFPTDFPELRVPGWYLICAVAVGLAALLTVRPTTRRSVVLGLGWAQCVSTVVLAFVIGDVAAMFCTWIAVPALALLAGQLRARGRKVLLATHVISSASWVGITVVFVAMSTVAMTATEIRTTLVTYELMALFDTTLLPWANFATTLSGLALGLTTKWGVIRYYWVAIKLAISVSILIMAFWFLSDAVESAIEEAMHLVGTGGTAAQIGASTDVVFWGFTTALFSLVAAMLLSLYKPGGRTPWGRRSSPPSDPRQRAQLPVTLAETRTVAQGTAALTLQPVGGAHGGHFPGWEPGAHIDLVLPSGRERQYSLYGDPSDTDAYRIAVLHEPEGRGGSEEIHQLRAGASLAIRGPRNNFALVDAPSYLFIAGGIGITPLLPMIHRVAGAGADWRLVYRGRSLATMPFATALTHQYPDRVSLLPGDTHARPDLRALLSNTPDGVAVYCCGPESLLSAVETAMSTHCAHGTLHIERFAASTRADDAANTPFEAELRQSGALVQVPADRTLLSAIQDVDPTVDLSCETGICASCATTVLAGTPDHRDDVLQPHERDRSDIIYPCVSRARGRRIVLDA